MRIDLNADETIGSLSLIVSWSQHIAGHANVFDFELLKQSCGIYLRRGAQNLLNCGIVIAAGGNRLFKYRRIAGYPADSVFVDHLLKFSGGYQIAPHVIEPDGLAQGLDFSQWIHK